jgi:hypothetical protein
MGIEKEEAMFLFKLARSKGNWGAKYDRLEHLNRFPNLKKIIKDLSRKEWIILKKKPSYIGVSLNTKYKREILEFVDIWLPEFSGYLK